MARKKLMSRELVADVVKRLMAEMQNPSPLASVPDVDRELRDIDAFVNRLMTTAVPDSKTSSATPHVEVVSGTKAVSLRIPCRVINAFKYQSMETGTNYQTLMNRALAEAAESFAI